MDLSSMNAKQKSDQRRHKQVIANKIARVYGALTYRCSKCPNSIRVHEKMADRKVLCTKCNTGFFNVLVKQKSRKHSRIE